MKVYYYQNGGWHPYASGVVTGPSSFTFTSKQSGKKIGVVGYPAEFSELGVSIKLANAKYFKTKKGATPSMFAFSEGASTAQPQPQPQPAPKPDDGSEGGETKPLDQGFKVNWLLVAVGVGAIAYFALNKKKKH